MLPDGARVQRAVVRTWRPAESWMEGAFTFRDGAGGGKRVSAATAVTPAPEAEVSAAIEAFRARGERPLFCVRPGDGVLDAQLASLGLGIVDPTILYAAPAVRLTDSDLPRLAAIAGDAPLAIHREIWAAGSIGPARIAVMERAPLPRTFLLGRRGDRPAGVAFVALDGDVAMIHAIEVAPRHRRAGVARALLRKAAAWAVGNDARYLGLAVTEANAPARALYASLGMEEVGKYHYRVGTEEEQG